ncbi:hypothetical protein PAL_GLEAN10005514 [Pteropus alecto]|uniref:Uncharacterized protein n=1 Tax=Pteropus alecto TaxID=9402 RepID=L5JTQ9_PTEAL|nr:hypothetical protein PAL_GLEAN10005514 [Pteropus alecto]
MNDDPRDYAETREAMPHRRQCRRTNLVVSDINVYSSDVCPVKLETLKVRKCVIPISAASLPSSKAGGRAEAKASDLNEQKGTWQVPDTPGGSLQDFLVPSCQTPWHVCRKKLQSWDGSVGTVTSPG